MNGMEKFEDIAEGLRMIKKGLDSDTPETKEKHETLVRGIYLALQVLRFYGFTRY